jgi:hypothetical protein
MVMLIVTLGQAPSYIRKSDQLLRRLEFVKEVAGVTLLFWMCMLQLRVEAMQEGCT